MTVEDLLGRMSSYELTEWQALKLLEMDESRVRDMEHRASDGIEEVKAQVKRKRARRR